jgi:hypothetical protein
MILNATATWLNKVITSGGSVIMIDSTAEVPGAVVVETEGLADALVAAVAPDLGISPPAPGIGFMHRHCQDIDVYVVAMRGPRPAGSASPRGLVRGTMSSGMQCRAECSAQERRRRELS